MGEDTSGGKPEAYERAPPTGRRPSSATSGIEITGDPDDPNRSPRINLQWAKEQIDKYGRDNPWVLVKVFGKFPPASLDSLLGLDEVQDAMRRDRAEPE